MLERLFPRRQPVVSEGAAADVPLGFYVRGNSVVPITSKGIQGGMGGGRKSVTGLYGISQQAAIRTRKELLASDGELALAYASNVIAHRCVDLRSQKVAEMPRRLVNKRTGEVVKDHPFLDAVRLSNKVHRKSIFYLWQNAKCIHGETYFLKTTDTFGRPLMMQWLNPTATEPFVFGGRILYFEYYDDAIGAQGTQIPTWQVMYDYYHNPSDDLRGLSPMQVALEPINVMNSIQAYQLSFFQNDATPGGLIGAKQGTILQKSDQDRLLKWWQEQLQGVRKRFKPVFLPFPLEWQNVQQPPSPEHTDIERAQIRKICDVFGVPVPLVDYDQARYQFSGEHPKMLYENTIIPDCEVIAEHVNNELLPFFDDSDTVRFEFEYDKVRALIDDQTKRTTAINARQMAGNITLNEARQRFGDAPIDGGDVVFVPKAIMAVDVEDLPDLDQLARPEPIGNRDPENLPMEILPENNGRTGTGQQDMALAELKAWRRKYKQKGLKGARNFREQHLPTRVADSLRSMLFAFPDDAPAEQVNGAFETAQRELRAVLDSELLAGLAERIREARLEDVLDIRNAQPD
jgi:HK97 family phage portal protein